MSSYLTEYDDDYSSAERTTATLCIYAEDMSPTQITEILAIEPTRTTVKGRVVSTQRGGSRVEALNAWFLGSEEAVDSRDLRRHLDHILSLVYPQKARLHEIQKENIKMRVNCVWWSASGQGGPALWPEQMRKLAELDLELDFDIYFFGEVDGETTKTTHQLGNIKL